MTEIVIPGIIQPYVDVLGIDGAFEFLMSFGGAETYFALSPGDDSRVVRAIGRDKAVALARRLDVPPNVQKVPLAKPFLAKVLWSRELPIAEIARRLHVDNKTVRRMLTDERQAREAARYAPDPRQLSFLDED